MSESQYGIDPQIKRLADYFSHQMASLNNPWDKLHKGTVIPHYIINGLESRGLPFRFLTREHLEEIAEVMNASLDSVQYSAERLAAQGGFALSDLEGHSEKL